MLYSYDCTVKQLAIIVPVSHRCNKKKIIVIARRIRTLRKSKNAPD